MKSIALKTGKPHFAWGKLALATDLPHQAKLIILYLQTFMASDRYTAWPSLERMVRETGLSKSTVCKYMKLLELTGWVTRMRRQHGRATEYRARVPDDSVKLAPEMAEDINSASRIRRADNPKSATRTIKPSESPSGSPPDTPLKSSTRTFEVLHTDTNKQVNNKRIYKPPLPPQGGDGHERRSVPFDPKTMIMPDTVCARAWEEWCDYQSIDLGRSVTQRSAAKQLSLLAQHDRQQQQEIVDQSIRNGWRGLFRVRGQTSAMPVSDIEEHYTNAIISRRVNRLTPDKDITDWRRQVSEDDGPRPTYDPLRRWREM